MFLFHRQVLFRGFDFNYVAISLGNIRNYFHTPMPFWEKKKKNIGEGRYIYSFLRKKGRKRAQKLVWFRRYLSSSWFQNVEGQTYGLRIQYMAGQAHTKIHCIFVVKYHFSCMSLKHNMLQRWCLFSKYHLPSPHSLRVVYPTQSHVKVRCRRQQQGWYRK